MEKNSIKEYASNNNYRRVSFLFKEQKYEMNVSLYSNAILVFICHNGKVSNIYELNINMEEEQEANEFGIFGDDPRENLKDIDIAQCVLGTRGNEHMDFIANFILSYIKEIIIKINSKINKICLSLNLDNNLIKNIEDKNEVKKFLDITKDNIGKIFQVNIK